MLRFIMNIQFREVQYIQISTDKVLYHKLEQNITTLFNHSVFFRNIICTKCHAGRYVLIALFVLSNVGFPAGQGLITGHPS